MEFSLYAADCRNNPKNCLYPNEYKVDSKEAMVKAASFDHVTARFAKNYRNIGNFELTNVAVMDCDNDHSEDPLSWIYPENYDRLFPGVSFVVVPSRNNMKEKDGKAARPRHHVYFPHGPMTDAKKYAELKRAIYKQCPFFDGNALDAARFIFGSDATNLIWHEGYMNIDQFLKPSIPKGQRNSTLSRFAGRVVKRYGADKRAYELFQEEAAKCEPPLSDEELSTIWGSAKKFAQKVQKEEGYIPPEKYDKDFTPRSLRPADFSDIGQAKMVAREYGNELCYTEATDYLRFNGERWVESKQEAVGAMEEFLDLQLADAYDDLAKAKEALVATGISEAELNAGGKKLEATLGEGQYKLLQEYLNAKQYLIFVLKRRDMRYIITALLAAKPMLGIDINDLDSNVYLLNVPGATFDLRDGISKEPDPADFITQQTSCSPDEAGKELWLSALDIFFCKDKKLIQYVKETAGIVAVGEVREEALIISYGEGRNGKSTFWNTIARVMGTYAGNMSADALTVGCKRNVKPEMAELKGKRLIIAAELEEGMRLNSAVIKQLCSTDDIYAEKKYKAPFKFTPSHTLVLYTNHLPKVSANDEGTWRRLIVIPFNAKIEGKSDIKNYADYLYRNAGGYILKWIMEGAKDVIQQDFKPQKPPCVEKAIAEYRKQNDWFGNFLDECCEVGENFTEKSGALYDEYRAYSYRIGEYVRNSADFYVALETAGFTRRRTHNARVVVGLRLKPPFTEE